MPPIRIAAAPDLPIHRRFDIARRIPFSDLPTRTSHPSITRRYVRIQRDQGKETLKPRQSREGLSDLSAKVYPIYHCGRMLVPLMPLIGSARIRGTGLKKAR